MEFNGGDVELTLKIADVVLIDVVYSGETELMTWNPHPKGVLEWLDFKLWIQTILDLHKAISG